MAAINLLQLEQKKISRDLKGKHILLFGPPKIGKTTFAAGIPNNLILSFEPGVDFISGIYAVPLNSWSEMRQYLSQLRKPELKEKFTSITIDTASLAFVKCEEYVCKREEAILNEKNVGERKVINSKRDIPWGQGWSMIPKEFGDVIREIVSLGYSLILLAHAKEKSTVVGSDANGKPITRKITRPDIDEDTYNLVNTVLNIVAYADKEIDDDGNEQRYLYTSGLEDTLIGTRQKYLASKIPLDYTSLLNAVNDALDKQAELDGAIVLDDGSAMEIPKKIPFEIVMTEAKDLWMQLLEVDKDNNGPEMSAIVQKYLGNTKLSQAKAHQQDLIEVIVAEMRELANK